MCGEVIICELKHQNLKIWNLKGLTWNSEGFKDPGKYLFVKESIGSMTLILLLYWK
jgi:hypothetical protein